MTEGLEWGKSLRWSSVRTLESMVTVRPPQPRATEGPPLSLRDISPRSAGGEGFYWSVPRKLLNKSKPLCPRAGGDPRRSEVGYVRQTTWLGERLAGGMRTPWGA